LRSWIFWKSPEANTNLRLTFLYIFIILWYCSAQPCSSAGGRFTASRSYLNYDWAFFQVLSFFLSGNWFVSLAIPWNEFDETLCQLDSIYNTRRFKSNPTLWTLLLNRQISLLQFIPLAHILIRITQWNATTPEGVEAKKKIVFLAQAISVGVRNDQMLEVMAHSIANRRSLMGLAVIHDYPEEGAILSYSINKVPHKVKRFSWRFHVVGPLIISNINFCMQSRPYPPEAFGSSSPGFGSGTKQSFCLCLLLLRLYPVGTAYCTGAKFNFNLNLMGLFSMGCGKSPPPPGEAPFWHVSEWIEVFSEPL